jgi:hypothetical protein
MKMNITQVLQIKLPHGTPESTRYDISLVMVMEHDGERTGDGDKSKC